jgi:mRNA interferase HigB
MRLFTQSTLNELAEKFPRHSKALNIWADVIEDAVWSYPTDIVKSWGSSDIIHTEKGVVPEGDCRVVFDIGGNHLRVVSHVSILYKSVYIKDCLTHREYDKIDWTLYKYEIKESSYAK